MIYTSYYEMTKRIPKSIVPISIAGWPAAGWEGLEFRKLAPRKWFFLEWKQNHDNQFYIRNFNEQVLSRFTPQQINDELLSLSGGKDVALLCYERPEEFCHRHLVAEWLTAGGFPCRELESNEYEDGELFIPISLVRFPGEAI